ncbi:hypothetical protein ACIBKY_54230 [Nonomuraea sp. NPDC050394]|uniref:hypothetical protein n=1 Tax=Nonomuraea sp. NPDC050394 TaxID=3364363 RepID=UPI00379649A0
MICERLVQPPRTLTDYKSKARNWIIPLPGKHRLDKLAPEHVQAAYATTHERGLQPSTILKIHRIISRALKIALRRGKITQNVATLMGRRFCGDHRDRSPDP